MPSMPADHPFPTPNAAPATVVAPFATLRRGTAAMRTIRTAPTPARSPITVVPPFAAQITGAQRFGVYRAMEAFSPSYVRLYRPTGAGTTETGPDNLTTPVLRTPFSAPIRSVSYALPRASLPTASPTMPAARFTSSAAPGTVSPAPRLVPGSTAGRAFATAARAVVPESRPPVPAVVPVFSPVVHPVTAAHRLGEAARAQTGQRATAQRTERFVPELTFPAIPAPVSSPSGLPTDGRVPATPNAPGLSFRAVMSPSAMSVSGASAVSGTSRVPRAAFTPVLPAAKLSAAGTATAAAAAARTVERTETPDVPAPGRPSVPQALWRRAAPHPPPPVERVSTTAAPVMRSVVPQLLAAPLFTRPATGTADVSARTSASQESRSSVSSPVPSATPSMTVLPAFVSRVIAPTPTPPSPLRRSVAMTTVPALALLSAASSLSPTQAARARERPAPTLPQRAQSPALMRRETPMRSAASAAPPAAAFIPTVSRFPAATSPAVEARSVSLVAVRRAALPYRSGAAVHQTVPTVSLRPSERTPITALRIPFPSASSPVLPLSRTPKSPFLTAAQSAAAPTVLALPTVSRAEMSVGIAGATTPPTKTQLARTTALSTTTSALSIPALPTGPSVFPSMTTPATSASLPPLSVVARLAAPGSMRSADAAPTTARLFRATVPIPTLSHSGVAVNPGVLPFSVPAGVVAARSMAPAGLAPVALSSMLSPRPALRLPDMALPFVPTTGGAGDTVTRQVEVPAMPGHLALPMRSPLFAPVSVTNSPIPTPSPLRRMTVAASPVFPARSVGIAAPVSPEIAARERRENSTGTVGTVGGVFRLPIEVPSGAVSAPARGAAEEIARTLRTGTLTSATLSRQTEPAPGTVSRDAGPAIATAPAPSASGDGLGGGAKEGESGDLMALERQVDALWDRFMQRLRIEQERSGFH